MVCEMKAGEGVITRARVLHRIKGGFSYRTPVRLDAELNNAFNVCYRCFATVARNGFVWTSRERVA